MIIATGWDPPPGFSNDPAEEDGWTAWLPRLEFRGTRITLGFDMLGTAVWSLRRWCRRHK
jgi:hypothetical protein